MRRRSHKSWKLVRKINENPKALKTFINITTNQVAHKLLTNGKPCNLIQAGKIIRDNKNENNSHRINLNENLVKRYSKYNSKNHNNSYMAF